MAAFKTTAHITHPAYGTSSAPASGLMRQNATMVARMATHNTTISITASPGRSRPKKIQETNDALRHQTHLAL